MKKPIDPNLDNLFDDLLGSDDIITPIKPVKPAERVADTGFTTDIIDEERKPDIKPFVMNEASAHSHHHSSSHHHSDGSHHHSDSSHHHSDGSHHHSDSSHHHSDSSHHHSDSSHHHSDSSHHHSDSSHHHSDSSHHHSDSSHHHSSSHSHRSTSHSHHHKKKKNKKKLSISAKIAIAFLLFLLLCVIAVVFTFIFLQAQGKSDLTSTAGTEYQETIEYKGDTYVYNNDIISIAFIGVDKRELVSETDGMGTAGQADADILLTINSKTGKAKAIAVPRDTMVDIDVYSESGIFLSSKQMQLCLSYAYGDGKTSSATNVTTSLSRILYDVPINKYFALDLDGIEAINDAVGGVTLTSLSDFESLGISKGDEVHLVGELTEKYVRTRDMNSVTASLERTARQTQYIKAFTAQLAPKVLDDFSVVSKLYNTATEYSTTNISLSNATYLATLLISNGVTSFDTVTIEGEMKLGTTTSPDNVYAEFYPDQDKLMEVVIDTFYIKK